MDEFNMPRRAHILLPGVLLHIIRRGKQSPGLHLCRRGCHAYLGWPKAYIQACGCDLQAFVMMTNRVHLLINTQHDSCCWTMDETTRSALCSVRKPYLQTQWNPMVKAFEFLSDSGRRLCAGFSLLYKTESHTCRHDLRPAEYLWSSYRANGQTESPCVQTVYPLCLFLRANDVTRLAAYRKLFRYQFDPLQSVVPTGLEC